MMKLLRTATFFIATTLACLGLTRSASADLYAYAATANGDFGKLDLTTGAYTSIGPSNVVSIVGMGFIGSTLYGVDNNTNGAGFYSINTSTGAATQISTLMDATGAPVTAYGGTTASGTFYGVTQDSPTKLFGATAAGGFLGYNTNPTFPADGLVALDSTGKNLYVSEYTGNSFTGDELWRVNVDASVHDVGPLNDGNNNGQQSITGLIFGNTLYSIDGTNIYTYTLGTSPDSVSSLQSTTAITGLDVANGDAVSAVAATGVVPEPSTMVIAGVVIAAAGLVHARRRYTKA